MMLVAAVLAYEGWRASVGHPDVGAFTAFFAALLTAAQALRQVANLLTLVSQGLAAGRRLFAALDVEAGDPRRARRAGARASATPPCGWTASASPMARRRC